MPFKRRHSQRCADVDILASAEIMSTLALSNDSHPRTVSVQSHQQCQQCNVLCHGLKHFSAKGMKDVMSDTD